MKPFVRPNLELELSVEKQARRDYEELAPHWVPSDLPGHIWNGLVMQVDGEAVPVSCHRPKGLVPLDPKVWRARQKYRRWVELRIQEREGRELLLAVDHALDCLANDLPARLAPGRKHFIVTTDCHGAVIEECDALEPDAREWARLLKQ
jgi:hypothetical protein